ncbi:PDZ domain-containing protein [Paucihalobacter ruber]|uniref:PDZ domain-containing protein n=1 Tax=Paucihalobacter ruber TaxID=2567861 RepID=A0A506PQV3_9FLAO|nr:aspartyl protease family protein [Paucihalobacter ruber]TPV35657.1 PDZ domain-containing protein [Paucihalobacter ruber]
MLISSGLSQNRFSLMNTESDKIKFELIDNLMVLPVSINGVELSFILDTGVSRPILFNILNFADSLQLKNYETTPLRGLGADGSINAIRSKSNVVKVGKALNVNQEIFVVFDNSINFTPILGVPVHGIIGFDLLKDFVVEINYRAKFLKLHNPETYKYKRCKKCETLNLSFSNGKPYLDAIGYFDNKPKKLKLLIDTGGSDDLWLFEDDSLGIKPLQNKYFDDYLGRGLSGNVYGKRSKVEKFKINKFEFSMVNTAFPDSSAIFLARSFKERSGSISGGLLRRFNLIFDYHRNQLTLKKNANYSLPFEYNKSGIVIEQRGMRLVREIIKAHVTDVYGRKNESGTTLMSATTYGYNLKPAFQIVEIRTNSVAEQAGLKIGDVVTSINGKPTQYLSLQQVNKLFYLKAGSTVKMVVDRNDKEMSFEFKLKDLFQ